MACLSGGAPNYYPNSFSAPEQQQKYALEHRTVCSGDVGRFNSADDDNVTQVLTSLSAAGVTQSFCFSLSADFPPSKSLACLKLNSWKTPLIRNPPLLSDGAEELLLCSFSSRYDTFQFL